jgi:threonine aldolase
MKVHLDGTRLFNACEALNVSPKDLAAYSDSVTICLSRGLGCPIGAVLAGPAEFIARALRLRKMLGGGLRQAGIYAAAGLYALERNMGNFAEDHRIARLLEGKLKEAGMKVFPSETNLVFFECPGSDLEAKLAVHGIRIKPATR